MTKPIVLTTGLNGLIGSKLAQSFQNKYHFKNLDLRDAQEPVDITNLTQVKKAFASCQAEAVVHLAAYTNVTGAWKQQDDQSGPAYQVNVTGTENIIKACKQTCKHLIHVSTAYVFDGQKTKPYIETDQTNPIEWYGQTKLWAEELVKKTSIPWTILRIDQPFRADQFGHKLDIAHRIIQGLKNQDLYPQFTNHYFGPTFIEDFVKVIDWVIRTKTTGLFHASSGEQWTDYDFANLIKQTLNLHTEVEKGDLNKYLKTLDRPYQQNTALNCDKLKSQLDFKMNSIAEAVQKLH
ncbi:MAG: sugar nucleotide-binding protein [Candidatus Pacebacteria bacterium]|nr:sugar nucleotide-binding protein [Candidatus Paceibacterota bacterium]